MTTTTNTGRNIALTIDGETAVFLPRKLEAAKAWARRCADEGSTVSLRWTDEAPRSFNAPAPRKLTATERKIADLESDLDLLQRVGHEDDDGQATEDAMTIGLISATVDVETAKARIRRELRSLRAR